MTPVYPHHKPGSSRYRFSAKGSATTSEELSQAKAERDAGDSALLPGMARRHAKRVLHVPIV